MNSRVVNPAFVPFSPVNFSDKVSPYSWPFTGGYGVNLNDKIDQTYNMNVSFDSWGWSNVAQNQWNMPAPCSNPAPGNVVTLPTWPPSCSLGFIYPKQDKPGQVTHGSYLAVGDFGSAFVG